MQFCREFGPQNYRRSSMQTPAVWGYVPIWVKEDFRRFPRAQIHDGEKIEILSTFSEANRKADAAAFAALMRHISGVDGRNHTVLMVQVENEVGVLGDSRDRCPQAEKKFTGPVPSLLMDYLLKHRSELVTEIFKRWEAAGFRSSGTCGYGNGPQNFFYALGEQDAMGISPFGVDSIQDPKESELSRTYAAIGRIAPLILQHQGKKEMAGFVLTKENPSIKKELGGYELEISLDSIFGFNAENGSGVVIAVGPNEFIGAGGGFRIRFKPKTPGPEFAGIGLVDEGTFRDGKWIPGRRLNGDENDQGRYWRFDRSAVLIERCVVYRWQ